MNDDGGPGLKEATKCAPLTCRLSYCWANVLTDREIDRELDRRNLRLGGKKGKRYQMSGNTKPEFNDPTIAYGCLLIGQVDLDIMVIKKFLV
jgi:hypothetical protein